MVKSVVPNSPDFSTVMSMRGAASLLMAAHLHAVAIRRTHKEHHLSSCYF